MGEEGRGSGGLRVRGLSRRGIRDGVVRDDAKVEVGLRWGSVHCTDPPCTARDMNKAKRQTRAQALTLNYPMQSTLSTSRSSPTEVLLARLLLQEPHGERTGSQIQLDGKTVAGSRGQGASQAYPWNTLRQVRR